MRARRPREARPPPSALPMEHRSTTARSSWRCPHPVRLPRVRLAIRILVVPSSIQNNLPRLPQSAQLHASCPAAASPPRHPHRPPPISSCRLDLQHISVYAAAQHLPQHRPPHLCSPSPPLGAWRRGRWSETLLGRCIGERRWTATVHH